MLLEQEVSIWANLHVFLKIDILRDHPFSTWAKCSKKLTFLTSWYAHERVHIRRWKMLVFSENFAYVLNRWALRLSKICSMHCQQSKPKIIFQQHLIGYKIIIYYSSQWAIANLKQWRCNWMDITKMDHLRPAWNTLRLIWLTWPE